MTKNTEYTEAVETRNWNTALEILEVNRLTSEKIQLWNDRIMLTVIPKSEAIQMIKQGKVSVINGQAIQFKK